MENVEIDKGKLEQFLKKLQDESHSEIMSFILEGKNIVPCSDINKFEKFIESPEKIIKKDSIGNLRISTVFLGINHAWTTKSAPILFETMIFKKKSYDGLFQERYFSYDEAEKGHANIKQKVIKWMRYKGKRATLRKLIGPQNYVKAILKNL